MAGDVKMVKAAKVAQVRALVLRTAGTNCDYETVYAIEKAGAVAERIHINLFKNKEVNMNDYQLLAIPGGFSYGDDIAAGRLMANEMKYLLKQMVLEFAHSLKPVIGICNGFQVLVQTGLLPGFELVDVKELTALANNDTGRFEDRWVNLTTNKKSRCLFTEGMGDIYLPIAHGEGKFMVADEETLHRIVKQGQIVFQYVNEKGKSAGYPHNPNGSVLDIAGICNAKGNVLGMMPHPERHVTRYQHPRWTREKLKEEGDGMALFKNAVKYAGKL